MAENQTSLGKAEDLLDDIIRRVYNRPWKTFGLLVFICVLIFLYNFIGELGGRTAKIDLPIPFSETTPETKTSRLGFSYQKKEWLGEIKDPQNGVIKTTFELFVYLPPFFQPINPEGGYSFDWHGDKSIYCMRTDDAVATSVADFGYTASTTLTYEAVCESYKSIIDNGHLFSLKEQ